MTLERPAPTILSIQYMRALAALLVVFAHAHDQLRVAMPYNPKLGHIGVDFFFVISGFIMVVVSHRKQPSAVSFMLDRIRRILPNYWFYTTVVAALAIIAPMLFRGTEFGFWHYVQSLFFIVHERPDKAGAVSPLLRLGWSLNYEIVFYLIFSAAILIAFRRRIIVTGAAIIFLVIVGRLFDGGAVARFYTGSIMLEFVAGMLIGAFYNAKGTPPARLAPLFWIALIATLAWANMVDFGQADRGFVYGIPASVVVFLALSVPATGVGLIGDLLKKLGDASYTIYLSHIFMLASLQRVWKAADLAETKLANYLFVLIAIIVVSASGIVAYRLVECRMDRMIDKLASFCRSGVRPKWAGAPTR